MIHIYFGNGKGKTTAAFGLALRALEHGRKVFVAQFMKGGASKEATALKKAYPKSFESYSNWDTSFIIGSPKPYQQKAFNDTLERLKQNLTNKEYDIVIADEILSAFMCSLIDNKGVLELMELTSANVELILTGVEASTEMVEMADLVTKMECVKHYYDKGTPAREGIEY